MLLIIFIILICIFLLGFYCGYQFSEGYVLQTSPEITLPEDKHLGQII